MVIAKDVLEMMASNKLYVVRGEYFHLENSAYSGQTLSERAAEPGTECRVCAIGAVFAGAMLGRGIDGKKQSSYLARDEIVEELSPYFSGRELSRLEQFFENTSYDYYAKDALRLAMTRLIETGGRTFAVPRQALSNLRKR